MPDGHDSGAGPDRGADRSRQSPAAVVEWTGEVERLAWGGRGLAHADDGRIILLSAPLALFPGERVTAQVQFKSGHGEGQVTGWLDRDQGRVPAGCPIAGSCGGCDLWEAGAAQAELKRIMVTDLFRRNLAVVPDWQWLPAPATARRNRIQLHWDGHQLGFHSRGTHEIVAATQCPLAALPISAAIEHLATALSDRSLPSESGRWELATGTPPQDVLAISGQRAGQAWLLAGDRWETTDRGLVHHLSDSVLHQSPGAFFQASPAWAWEACAALLQGWRVSGTTLYDLYGGGGFFSAMLKEHFKRFVLVESSPASIADAGRNLAGQPVELHQQDVSRWLNTGLGEAGDTVILDPPRAGLAPQVTIRLGKCRAGTLILVGCDGAIFCRDIKRLAPAWRLEKLAAIDLFPNTVHVECIGLLKPA